MNRTGAIIEAILFVTGDPVKTEELAHALNLTVLEMEKELDALRDTLELEGHGLKLNRNGSSVYLSTDPSLMSDIERYLQPVRKTSLSQAVLETLSVIAYRQPVTRGDIEAVRGVKCDYSVQLLLSRGLIEEQGHRETLGRPILYGTTDKFLEHFGIETLSELPQADLPAEELPTV